MSRSRSASVQVRRARARFHPEIEWFESRWYPGDILVPLAWASVGKALLPAETEFGQAEQAARPTSPQVVLLNLDSAPPPLSVSPAPTANPQLETATGALLPPNSLPPVMVPAQYGWQTWAAPRDLFADPLGDLWNVESTAGPRKLVGSGEAGTGTDKQAVYGGDTGTPPPAPLSFTHQDGVPVAATAHAAVDLVTLASRGGSGDPGTPPGGGIGSAAATPQRFLQRRYAQMPLSFEPNRGQSASQVQFLSRGQGYNLYLTGVEAVLVLHKNLPAQERTRAVVRLQLVGANAAAKGVGLEALPGVSNYIKGQDPRQWRTGVPHFGRVQFPSVYPRIDLVYYGSQRQVEFDFVVQPGGNPADIQLRFTGAGSLRLDARGNLILGTQGGEVVQRAPVLYQRVNGLRLPVVGQYVLNGTDRVGFQVLGYDTTRPLYIDPVLSYSSYLGGSGDDDANAVAVDAAGNTYLAGSTNSSDFPVGNPTQSYAGALDAFVAKLDPTGSTLMYATYLGGASDDEAFGIAVDVAGNAYVTGQTKSTAFPTINGYSASRNGDQDVFLTKLSQSGRELVYSTYLGGSGTAVEEGRGVAVDLLGNAYLTGKTNATNFPTSTSPAAYQGSFGGGASDAFLAKIDTTAAGTSSLRYSSYLGGSGDDVGRGLAVDTQGRAYLTGDTTSTNFPTVNAMQGSNGGGTDAFIAKLDPAVGGASGLVYSTYLGGSALDEGWGIALDTSRNAHVTGRTRSSSGIHTTGGYQTSLGGGTCGSSTCADAFLVKLNAAGSSKLYGTYLGGNQDDEGKALALDASGVVHLTGSTNGGTFPLQGAIQSTFGGVTDAFVSQLNPALTGSSQLVFSTFLGGAAEDIGRGIALDSDRNAFVAGLTKSTDFPLSRPFQDTRSGNSDAFLSKLSPLPAAPVFLDISTDSGVSTSDQLTTDQTPTLSGYCDPDGVVTIYQDGVKQATTATADSTGLWSWTAASLSEGVHYFNATVTSNNVTSDRSLEFLVTIDLTGPTLTLNAPSTSYDLTPEVRLTASDLFGLPQDATGDYRVFLDVDANGDNSYTGSEVGYTTATLHDGFALFEVSPALTVGTRKMRARLKDAAGNETTSAEKTVTLQTSPTNWTTTAEYRVADPLTGDMFLQNGAVQIVHPVDLDLSPGMANTGGAALVFVSDQASFKPIIRATVQSDNAQALPTTITPRLTWDGTLQTTTPIGYLTSARTKGELITVATQITTGSVATGRHTWSMEVTMDYATPIVRTVHGIAYVVNWQENPLDPSVANPLGNGWSFSLQESLIQINSESDYNGIARPEGKLRAFGTGGWRFYKKLTSTTFESPAGDNGTLTYDTSTGIYSYKLPDGQEYQYDSNGWLSKWASATGDDLLTLTYDATNKRLSTVTTPDSTSGYPTLSSFSYDSSTGKLRTITMPGETNRLVTLTHTGSTLTTIENPDNGLRTFSYDNSSWPNVVTAEVFDTENRSWAYAGNGRVSSATDGAGDDATTLTISPAATQGLSALVAGEPVAKTTDGLSHSTRTTLDALGRPLTQVAGDGGLWAWTRDSHGRVTSMTDPLGRTTSFGRDSQGYVTIMYLPDGNTRKYSYNTTDSRTRLVTMVNERTATTVYSYTGTQRRLEVIQDANNQRTTIVWDSTAKRPQYIINPKDVRVSFVYDERRRVTQLIQGARAPGESDEPSCVTFAEGAAAGVSVCDYDGPISTTFQYDPDTGEIRSWTDGISSVRPITRVVTFTRDRSGRPQVFKEGYGTSLIRTTTIVWDKTGKPTTVSKGDSSTNPNPRTTSFGYDAAGRQSWMISPRQEGVYQSYDAAGKVATSSDPRGQAQKYAYHATGRPAAITTAAGMPRQRVTTIIYDLAGNPVYTLDPLGRVSKYEYDARNRPTRRDDGFGTPEQRHSTATYDAAGNLLSFTTGQASTNAHVATTTMVYDYLDRRTQIIESSNDTSTKRTTTLAYDALGAVTTITRAQTYDGAATPVLLTTTYDLDRHQRLRAVYEADGSSEKRTTVHTTYDAANNPVQVITGDGPNAQKQLVGRTFDLLGRVTEVQEGQGSPTIRTTDFTWDATDNLLTVVAGQGTGTPQSLTTKYGYDANDRMTQVTQADGTSLARTTYFAYNAAGQLAGVLDPVYQTTVTGFDELHRPTHRIDALGNRSHVSYDAADHVTEVLDPLDNRWGYAYDPLDRLSVATDPTGDLRTFAYDAAGNLKKTTDRNNREREFSYDKLNRRTQELWRATPGGTIQRTMTYAFDAQNNLTSVSDPDTLASFVYDKLNRPTQLTYKPVGTTPLPTMVYIQTFSAADRRLEVVVKEDATTNYWLYYTYDSLRRVTAVKQDVASSTTLDKRVEIDSTALDRFKELRRYSTLTGGTPVGTTTADYDAAARLTTYTHAQGSTRVTYTLQYDNADRNTRLTYADGNPTLTYDYSYDVTSQLTGVSGSATETYTYDANGNRTMTSQWTTGTANRLTGDPLYTYTYDDEGNRSVRTERANGKVTSYVWDQQQRLTEVISRDSAGGAITKHVTYSYDAFGRRIAKSVDNDGAGSGAAQRTRFTYDGGNLALAYTGTTSLSQSNRYLHGPAVDQVFADEQSGGTYWALSDHLGSVRDLVDNNGTFARQRKYDAYGKVTSSTPTSGGAETLFAYTGRELDAETGLQYHRARYYDAGAGRWLSEDPIGFGAGDGNLYRYVRNRSTNAIDPSGLDDDSTVIGIACPTCTAIDPEAEAAVQRLADEGNRRMDERIRQGDDFEWWVSGFSGYISDEERAVTNYLAGYSDRMTNGLGRHLWEELGCSDQVDFNSDAFAWGDGTGVIVQNLLPQARACQASAIVNNSIQGLQALQAAGNALNALDHAQNMHNCVQNGDWGGALVEGLQTAQCINGAMNNVDNALADGPCFAAGTPMLTPDGAKPIEQFRSGDWVLSAPEDDPEALPVPKMVKSVSRKHGRLFNLHVGEQVIRATGEHPFFVKGRGWASTAELQRGHLLRSHDGQWVPVREVFDTGEDSRVYNLHIAEYHTYFVGARDWGFSVWAHNNNPNCPPVNGGQGTAAQRPSLPEFDGENTQGVLFTNEGQQVPLQSGNTNPAYTNYAAAGHVEGQAAIWIRDNGSTGGTVYHNNTNGTCGFCHAQIETLLPPNATLNVVPPENAVPNNPWAHAEPTSYLGNPNEPRPIRR